MAWFDLKNAEIYFRDGFGGVGAVNNSAGYSSGATTMLIDGYVGIIPVGARFTLVSDTVKRTVTSHTETSGNTTSITFTPALTATSADNAVITFIPNELKIKVGEGTLSYTEKRAIEYKMDRGVLDSGGVRLGNQEPMDVSLDFWWDNITGSATDPPTVEDVVKHRGAAASWVNSGVDKCTPFAVDMYIQYSPPCSTIQKELIKLPEFRYESIAHDLKAATMSCTGKCLAVQAIPTRLDTF